MWNIWRTRRTAKVSQASAAALVAFGVQLSVDAGYGGMMYLKAKTPEIRERYIRDFGAIPFSPQRAVFLLLIDGDASVICWHNF